MADNGFSAFLVPDRNGSLKKRIRAKAKASGMKQGEMVRRMILHALDREAAGLFLVHGGANGTPAANQ